MVERVSDARLEEAKALDRDSEVVVVPSEIFTRFRVAVSFSLRYSHEQEGESGGRLLTVRPVPHSIEESLGECNALFELVHMLAHCEETFVGLPHLRERVQKAVRYTVNDTRRLLWHWRVRDVLVHDDMLSGYELCLGEHRCSRYAPIRLTRRRREATCFVGGLGGEQGVAGNGASWR